MRWIIISCVRSGNLTTHLNCNNIVLGFVYKVIKDAKYMDISITLFDAQILCILAVLGGCGGIGYFQVKGFHVKCVYWKHLTL